MSIYRNDVQHQDSACLLVRVGRAKMRRKIEPKGSRNRRGRKVSQASGPQSDSLGAEMVAVIIKYGLWVGMRSQVQCSEKSMCLKLED